MRRRMIVEGDVIMQDLMAMRLMDTMIEYSNSEVTSVITYGFAGQTKLETVSLPNCQTIEAHAFNGCNGLLSLNMPNLTKISHNSFRNCSSLAEFITGASFNSRLDTSTFEGCSSLTKADFYHITNLGISSYALACANLTTLIIRNTDFVPIKNANAFGATTTKMNTGEGKIYVPESMVSAYKADSNWSNYADQIFSLEELV